MKKNFLLYLLVMALPITFFSACGDNDDDKDNGGTTPTWKDGVGAYKKETASAILKIDGAEPESTKSVTLAAGTGDNAKITLTNIVPDDATVEFDNVEMKKTEANYTFSSEKTVGTTTISISGTLSGIPATKEAAVAKTLDIKVTRKIDSPIVGTWKLNFTETGGGDVFFDVITGDPANDVLIPQLLGPAFGGMLAQKVTAVTASFTEAGIFDVTWVNLGETESTGMPPTVKPMVGDIMYFVSEDQAFLALKKTLIPVLQVLAEGFDIESLLASMIDKGDYVALPINITIAPAGVSFYLEKEMILKALPIIVPMFAGLGEQMPPELAAQIVPLLENLPEIVTNSEKFNVGMNFIK
ncbi:MAG: DUF4925 domain-containing protein [Tannerellaceae bacterium]|nr:DUF4925 domain-containing protein [Tannerellaceae bacterium]